MPANNPNETVREILKRKKANVKQAALDPGSPGWGDIMDMTWAEVLDRAQKRLPGYQTLSKLLTSGRFDKPPR
jgi:hypothetical protein